LNAEQCEIYTDVNGVFTADPLVVPDARHLKELGAAEMQELAWTGAKVLKAEAVEFASTNSVPIVVRSTFENGRETRVHPPACVAQTFRPRRAEVAGVAGRKDLIRITLSSTDFGNGCGELIFDLIGDFDLILGATGSTSEPVDILISDQEIANSAAFAIDLQESFGHRVALTDRLGLVSIVGFGLGTRPAYFLSASRLLRDANISVLKSFTTRESLCFVVPVDQVDKGVLLMHETFIQTQPVFPVSQT
jgi:aspartate kinase